ncbi:protein quiver-like isoform X2 [Mya arenaria]|uniref:protein quiver-like isoform X2 n=1 Tax=Mya arenaria TaxID=6604 RepID=UPI0022DF3687|nr:protein quiver-like isoform X2 [Mya arenaria]
MDRGMSKFRYLTTALCLLQVLLTVPTALAGEEDCIGMAGRAPILCYDCSAVTEDHPCNDPFNETMAKQVEVVMCKEYCVKWTRKTLSGKRLVQRTCSKNMEISIRKTVVCIHESRPSEGQLCFCNEDKCNTAPKSRPFIGIRAAISLAVLFHVILLRCLR